MKRRYFDQCSTIRCKMKKIKSPSVCTISVEKTNQARGEDSKNKQKNKQNEGYSRDKKELKKCFEKNENRVNCFKKSKIVNQNMHLNFHELLELTKRIQ